MNASLDNPPPTPQAGGREAAAWGAIAIAGYAFAYWLSFPGIVAAVIGLVIAYGLGFLDAKKGWVAYHEARERDMQIENDVD